MGISGHDFIKLLAEQEDEYLDGHRLGSALWYGGDPADFVGMGDGNWRGVVTDARQTIPTLEQFEQGTEV